MGGGGHGTNTLDSHSRASETEQLSNSPSSTASSHVKRNLINGFGKFDGSIQAEDTVIRMQRSWASWALPSGEDRLDHRAVTPFGALTGAQCPVPASVSLALTSSTNSPQALYSDIRV
uniref:Uncharacterized protein n=1 Tax=Rangifer tarandus platyrhynchus TaxID=3082113 RepID=A0ACB0F4N2_RANTA|nr:unnamed protein product [Rangifer tarandus platyrhynchus]